MKTKILEKKTIEEYYLEILKVPEFLSKLSIYELKIISSFANELTNMAFFQNNKEDESLILDSNCNPNPFSRDNAIKVELIIDEYLTKKRCKQIKKQFIVTERLTKELKIIQSIFQCQVIKKDQFSSLPFDIKFHSNSNNCNDSYFDEIVLFSDDELFDFNPYKKYLVKKGNFQLIRNQLNDILEFTENISEFYSKNIEGKKELLNMIKIKKSNEKDYTKQFDGQFKIENYEISEAIISNYCPDNTFDVEELPKFFGTLTNKDLNDFCLQVIDFIEKFELKKRQNNVGKNPDYNTIADLWKGDYSNWFEILDKLQEYSYCSKNEKNDWQWDKSKAELAALYRYLIWKGHIKKIQNDSQAARCFYSFFNIKSNDFQYFKRNKKESIERYFIDFPPI